MVSTRGRYALRVLIDLAEHNNGSYIPMKDVAARQELSLKYLERIVPTLTKAKLIAGVSAVAVALLIYRRMYGKKQIETTIEIR